MNHKKLTGSYLVLFLFIIGCSIGIYSPPISQKSAGNVTNLPKANDNELTLITPENKTYTRPDRGYYPATYGFENVINGQDDPDWNDVSSQKGNIISEMDGHEKVYEVTDNSGSSAADLLQYYDIQSHGTVEFWCRFTSAIEGNYYRLSGSITLGPTLNIDSNQFIFTNSSGGHPIPGAPIPQVNTWYHIRFDFRGSYSSEYSGLTSQYTYFIYINTIRYGPFTYEENGDVDTFQVHTSVAGSGFIIWWDAVGYSWDPNYNIGDNLNEGLLLSYENTTTLDWEGYSLDGQTNKTILGNTTMPMPSDGVHTIQVFANDSMGSNYESNLRWFTVDYSPFISILTPENKTYTQPDSGYYPATYGFENVINGQDDPDWNDVSSQKGNIISEMDGHEKVYEVTDNSGSSAADLLQYYDIQSHGTVEFWCRFTSAIEGNYYRLSGPVTLGPTLNIYLNQFQFTNSSGGHPIPGAPIPQVNTWYHIRFDFRGSYSSEYSGLTSQYTYFIYINTIRYGPFTYEENGDVDTFQVHTSVAGSGFTIWWDAVGYSWDPNYNIGDNLNEGLLLSYDTNSNLNWTGYSSDGQLNETILGNTTIPMPSDGHHNIQVFGNDSMGVMAESDVRYFTTNVLAPSLSIISPLSNDLIGNIAPLFSLNIPDGDLNDTWYSLDEGTTTIPFTSLSGTIDQTEWDKISNGTATLTFYANDTANNIGQAEVTIRKDIIAPVITIFSPSTGIKFDYAPVLETVITEGNLDEFWYTIDEGVHNYTLTGLSDTIDQDLWNSAPNGPVTIRFYARDLAGNVGTNYVIVVKISTQQPPAIPGYDLSLIIGIFSIISILIIRKRLKS